MSEEKIQKEILGKLKLENLVQISKEDVKKEDFKFLDFGKIFLHYKCKIVEVDAFASRLAGNDNNYQLERIGFEDGSISIPIPENTTHFYLGEIISDEEMYLNHKENSYSRDIAPIIFLRK